MNEHDSERLAGQLVADGLVPAGEGETPDVVVLNTCTIRENADLKFFSALGHLKGEKARHKGMQIAVTGCMAQRDKGALLSRYDWVDVVAGTHNMLDVPALLRRSETEGSIAEVLDAPNPDVARDLQPALAAVREVAWSSWMTIQTGCDNSCTYCIVPSVRGGEISRPLEDLVAEAEVLASSGVTEITVLGQNVNSYGRDITGRSPLFAELLIALGAVHGIERIRFTSPHPKDLRPEVLEAMAATPAVCPQLHLPLQSGSDSILVAMHRGYRAERYLEKLRMARELVPDLHVSTDIIVGFPGETDDDFEATLRVAAEAAYDLAFTFMFSPREGTVAAGWPEKFVPDEVVKERFLRLKDVTDRSALLAHEGRVGLLEEVLIEGPSRRNEGVLSGYTRQGKLVHFPGSLEATKPGSLVSVRIESGAPHFLRGAQEKVLRTPRHKVRIPLSVS